MTQKQLVYKPFGLIGWMPKFNNRLEYGTLEPGGMGLVSKGHELATSIAEKEWKADYPASIAPLTDQDDIVAILDYRKDYLKRLEDRANGEDVKDKEKKILLSVIAALKSAWRKDDEWVIPEFIGITGNRRASVAPWAIAYKRIGLVETLKGEDGEVSEQRISEIDPNWNLEVPCLVYNLDRRKDFVEWHNVQTSENSDDVHRKPYTPQEQGLIAIAMWMSGIVLQQAYRNMFGATNGVKLFVIAKLNNLFPNLKIRDRIAAPSLIEKKPNPDYVNVQALRHSDLQQVQQRISTFALDQLNRERAKAKKDEDKKALTRMYEADVDRFLRDGGFNEVRDKAMSLKDAVEVAEGSVGIDLLSRAFSAMKSRDLADALKNDAKRADLYNLIPGMSDEQYEASLAAVTAILSPPVNIPETTVVEPITPPVAVEVVDETKPPKGRKSSK